MLKLLNDLYSDSIQVCDYLKTQGKYKISIWLLFDQNATEAWADAHCLFGNITLHENYPASLSLKVLVNYIYHYYNLKLYLEVAIEFSVARKV